MTASWARRGLQLLFAVVGAVLLVVGPVTPAHAASLPMEFSSDGVSWAATAPAGLFESGYRVVPGDTQTRTLYVRSTRTEPTRVDVVLANASSTDPAFGAALFVSGGSGATTLSPVALDDIATCTVLVPSRTLARGDVLRIDLTLALSAATAGLDAQGGSADLDVLIGMTDPGAPATADNCPRGASVVPAVPATTAPAPAGAGGVAAAPPAGAGVAPDAAAPGLDDPATLPGITQSSIDPNTWRLFEERIWFLFVLALVTGSLAFMVVDLVRRRRGLTNGTEAGA